MKFGIRSTSSVYPQGTGKIWEDTKAGNDLASYVLFVEEVMGRYT